MVKKVDLESEIFEGKMKMDDYDDCVCGIIHRFGMESIICYDLQKVIKKLQKDGMTRDEAYEFWEFNQLGAWVGETTPCFLDKEIY